MSSNKIVRALKNPYVFSVISKLSIVLLGFAYTVCQSRYLGASIKGDIAYISSITQITSILFGIGIHQAYPNYKKKAVDDVAPLFVKLTMGITLCYAVLAIILSLSVRKDFKMISVFLMTPLLVYNRIVAYINMVEAPNRKNATELIADIVLLIAVIILWITTPATVQWGVFLLVIKDLLLAIIYTYRLRKPLLAPVTISIRKILGIIEYGIYPMLALLMTTLNYRVDVIMLKQFVNKADVGIYSVGVMLAERVWMIPDALKEVMISNLAKGKGVDEVSFVIRICNSACIIVVIGILLLGQPFINLFFGAEYSSAYSVTVIILVGVIFMVYYKMIGAFNIVEGKQRENFIYLVVSVICNIALNLVLIPMMGKTGAATASIFSYAISAGLFIRKFLAETPVKLRDMLFLNKQDIIRLKTVIKK